MIEKLGFCFLLAVQAPVFFSCAGVPAAPVLSSEFDSRSISIPVMLNAELRQIEAEHLLYATYSESRVYWIAAPSNKTNAQGWFPEYRPVTHASGIGVVDQIQEQVARSDTYLVVTSILFKTHSSGFWPFYGEASAHISVRALAKR